MNFARHFQTGLHTVGTGASKAVGKTRTEEKSTSSGALSHDIFSAAPREDVVVGVAVQDSRDHCVAAAIPMIALHVFNLNHAVTEDNLKDHLSKIVPGIEDMTVTKLRSDGRSSSWLMMIILTGTLKLNIGQWGCT